MMMLCGWMVVVVVRLMKMSVIISEVSGVANVLGRVLSALKGRFASDFDSLA